MNYLKGLKGIDLPGFSVGSRYTLDDRRTVVDERTFQLDKSTVYRLKRKAQTLRVVSGTAWVTFRGDYQDYFVQPGEEMVIRRGRGKAQVYAIGGPLVFEVR